MLTIETRPIARLIPHVRNARTHSADQIAQIAGSIAEFGFVNPVLIGADDVIIAGHGRVLAAEKLGLAEVPVIVLSHLSESQRRALVIADNRIAENAGWDEPCSRPRSPPCTKTPSISTFWASPRKNSAGCSMASTPMQAAMPLRTASHRPMPRPKHNVRLLPSASAFRPSRFSMPERAGGRIASAPGRRGKR
jgi:hypothetical protein